MAMVDPSAARTVLRVKLVPGERVIYFHRENYDAKKRLFSGLGAVSTVIGLIGFVVTALGNDDPDGRLAFGLVALAGPTLIAWGLLYHRGKPKAQIVTNRRVIGIDHRGVPHALLLEDAHDIRSTGLRPEEAQLAAMASGTPLVPTEPFYWGGTSGLALANGRFKLKTQRPAELGPFVACCILEPGFVDRCPEVPHDA